MLTSNPPANPAAPAVTVVMATYNMGQYLGAAIRSVLDQTFSDLELRIVDDGSTDNTAEVVAPYLVDPRVYYLRQDNAGQTKAKNVGVRGALGRYVGFCDADDLWHPEKLARQLLVFAAHPEAAVVYARVRPMQADGTLLSPITFPEHSGTITSELFISNFIPFGTALVRRDALESVGGFDENRRMGIDWDLWLRLSVNHTFQHLPMELYFYRVWEGQMSRNWKGRYDSAFQIMGDFERAHPGLIGESTRARAYGESYVNRAEARIKIANDKRGGLADCVRALRYAPSRSAALRTIVKLAIRHPSY